MNIFTSVKYCCILHGRVCVMTRTVSAIVGRLDFSKCLGEAFCLIVALHSQKQCYAFVLYSVELDYHLKVA